MYVDVSQKLRVSLSFFLLDRKFDLRRLVIISFSTERYL